MHLLTLSEHIRKKECCQKAKAMKKNQYECPRCKEVLTSKHNYDMQKCSCGALAIDGGENLRIIELDATAFTDNDFKKSVNDFVIDFNAKNSQNST